ncbi:hypothetical protein BDV26DRAFT_268633 [Aspergillus bertholletiae]|uniref:Uncharacterized protein n=1 Tax=Aspergillus bertholletiae TaxID=1226010 RepID=A0A5N7AZ13_9EURO|nr:hypothetical protein BDV26DRAFT_268633 [Aspergillus bertholletiae]
MKFTSLGSTGKRRVHHRSTPCLSFILRTMISDFWFLVLFSSLSFSFALLHVDYELYSA